ncbi:MAG: YdcF family protein [Clostridia bacterium]|nr:YdcF family protein [Clostridia bacterium]
MRRYMKGFKWKFDAILLLGVELDADDRPTMELGRRMYAAVDAWCRYGGPALVVCGGVLPGHRASEAQVMEALLVRAGVARERIIREEKSQTTMENMRYAAQLLGGAKGKHVLVVTSDYHLRRAMMTAKRVGFRVSGIGAPLDRDDEWKRAARKEWAYIVDLLMGWQDEGRSRPQWTYRLFGRVFGGD